MSVSQMICNIPFGRALESAQTRVGNLNVEWDRFTDGQTLLVPDLVKRRPLRVPASLSTQHGDQVFQQRKASVNRINLFGSGLCGRKDSGGFRTFHNSQGRLSYALNSPTP